MYRVTLLDRATLCIALAHVSATAFHTCYTRFNEDLIKMFLPVQCIWSGSKCLPMPVARLPHTANTKDIHGILTVSGPSVMNLLLSCITADNQG